MVNSALGKNCHENLICQLLIFLNGMDVCTPFLENGKTELKKTHFYLKLWINKHCLGFIMVSSREHVFYNIFKVKASHIYEIFVQKKFKPPTAKAKISAKFKITEDLWSRIYTMASKCTLDTKTRIFQFKILDNVLYLNKQLYKMNLSVSPLCSL